MLDPHDTMVMQKSKGGQMDRYEALKHAVKAHGSDTDRCGRLYVLHPIAVAEVIEAMETSTWLTLDEDDVVVALLHDVWEDTEYGPLLNLTNNQRIALQRITYDPERETYAEYINGVCGSATASVVKLADLWHNLQPERQRCLPEKEQRSLETRYLKARQTIWDALGLDWWPS